MLVTTLDELLSVRAKLKQAVRQKQRIGYDSEYDAPSILYRGKKRLDVLRADIVGYSLAFKGSRRGHYIPLKHDVQPDSTRTPEFVATARKMLRLLEVEELEVWTHNAKGEIHAAENAGVVPRCRWLDSELCAWMCGWKLPGKGGLKLKALVKEHLGYDGPTFEDIAKGRQASQVPATEIAPYAARDAVLHMALGELAWERMGELDLYPHYDIERRCIPVSAAMERTGVPLDEARLLADAARCEAEMAEVAKRFHNITLSRVALPAKVKEQAPCEACAGAGSRVVPGNGPVGPCNATGCVSGLLFFKNGKPKMRTVTRDLPTLSGADVGNDRQVARWMFDELRWWPTDEHPRNEVSWSVAEEDIRRFTTLPGLPGEAARLRLRFQALRKYASTYTRGLVDLARQSGDGRLHCGFKQDGTMTSRYSSSGPNLQNLPSSDRQDLPWLQDLPDTRACFMAAHGWRVVERDVSQGELRLAAHFSQDPNLLHIYRTGGDIHANTMEKIGCMRRPAKVQNFSTLYGISDKSLATKVHMATNDWGYTVPQAKADIEAWYGAYPGVRPWQAEVVEAAESNRYAETITGFKEPLTNWSRFGRFGSERKAVNTRIQGSLGGIMKVVMVALYERWKREGKLGVVVRFVAQVHDSLVFEAREDFADEANRVCGECMLWAGRKYGLLVPLESSGGVGESWAAAH